MRPVGQATQRNPQPGQILGRDNKFAPPISMPRAKGLWRRRDRGLRLLGLFSHNFSVDSIDSSSVDTYTQNHAKHKLDPMKNPATAPNASYRDILQVLPQLPAPDLAAATAAMAAATPENREQRGWLARWQGRANPQLQHPRLALFAANHGIGAVWCASIKAKDAIAPILRKEGALIEMAVKADCDLRVYEMSLGAPSRHFNAAAAMDQAETVRAISYGMAAVDMGLDMLALASCGDGQELAAAVIIAGVTQQPVMTLATKLEISLHIAAQIAGAAERAQTMDACTILENFGGPEIAALLGAMIAARMAHTPVVIADWGGLAALCLLDKLDRRSAQHVALVGPLCKFKLLPDHQRLAAGDSGGLGIAAAQSLIALRAAM